MLALLIGSVLAVGAVAYVLLPLLRPEPATPANANPSAAPAPESSAIEALREIEFDKATGKLSETDYAALKSQYTPLALAELRAREQNGAATNSPTSPSSAFKAVEDPAEALISNIRAKGLVCPIDGPRPEQDALFCSECGRELSLSAS